jgi:hypothetical protein
MAHPFVQPSLHEIVDRQQSIITRPQLISAGIDDHAIYRKVRRGSWQRVLPGIYHVETGPLTLEHRRIAGALFTGESAQLTGGATLLWYGFKSPVATDRIHALVPHESRRRSAGFVIVQRALSLDHDARDAGSYRVTSPARAAIDYCRLTSDFQSVRAIMTEAVQAHFASEKALDDEIRRAARSRTALARRALTEICDGVRSSPEAELREITSHSKILPAIVWNPQLTDRDGIQLPSPDGWIADAAIALEVDSREYHSSSDGWRQTLRRHNTLSEQGVMVLHFTPAEIRSESARVLRVIEKVYRHRAGVGSTAQAQGRGPS